MGTAEHYRKKAAEMAELARQERNASSRLDFHILAQGYLRLANRADQRDQAEKPAREQAQVQQPQTKE